MTMTATGVGRAGAHHGEILQGVFTVDGALCRALVTLPCERFETQATVTLEDGRRQVAVTPAWKTKAGRAARVTLDSLGLRQTGARIAVHGEIPVGRGFGSSTSDVLATIRGVAAAAGAVLGEAEFAKLAVESETASDPLMFDRAVLFAQRDGVVLEDFGVRFPLLEVLGFATTAEEAGVSTLEFMPAEYSESEAEAFATLRVRLRESLARRDVRELGLVATESASLNQRHLAVARFGDVLAIADRAGAAGVQVAHSGDVAGLLFDANDREVEARTEEARTLLAAAGFKRTWRFTA
jgi:uncharacterized protein involved in propanediol utilization